MENPHAPAILRLRKQLAMSQEEMAHKIGVTVSTFNRWEKGHALPSPLAVSALIAFAREHGQIYGSSE